MGTITLSLPNELKIKMGKLDWINWSSVARHAFSRTLNDAKELELIRKVKEISEISEYDNREVKESVFKEFVESVEKTSKNLKSGKLKPMTLDEFNKWCDSI
ncbi:hypothetical protein FP803_05075 [Candidatus Woesearchaeota archaeon]|nr:hypothetical protein [Candidatus Woesearchaeota archaeon]